MGKSRRYAIEINAVPNSMKKQTQLDKFKEAARALETNNNPAEFDRKMKRLKLTTAPTKKPSKAKGQ